MKNFTLVTKLLKYTSAAISTVLLLSCGNIGDGSSTSSSNLGNLQSVSQESATYPVALLQATVTSFVCPGTLQESAPALCASNTNYIESSALNSTFGQFNIAESVVNNDAGVTSVDAYKIIYTTPGVANVLTELSDTETVSGAVLVPNIPESEIKGIILYYHPTVLDKTSVPSNFTGASYNAIGLAAVYASQGYIVVAPDYIGYAANAQKMHPYVAYPEANALSGLYMLTATRQFLSNDKGWSNTAQKLYISSYSEGGAYALWASKLLQGSNANILSTNNLQLALTVGVSGAYDLMGTMNYEFSKTSNISGSCLDSESSVCNPYMISPGGATPVLSAFYGLLNASNSKVPLTTFALSAFIYYNTQDIYSTIMNPDYVNMQNCLDITSYYSNITSSPSDSMKFSCNLLTSGTTFPIPNIFTSQSTSLSQTAIGSSLIASAMWNGKYITNNTSVESIRAEVLTTGYINNSISAFVDPSVQTEPIFVNFMNAASINSWNTNSPITLIHLKYDSTVPVLNTVSAESGITPSSLVTNVSVDNTNLYEDASPIYGNVYLDHGYAGFILDIAALNQIKAH